MAQEFYPGKKVNKQWLCECHAHLVSDAPVNLEAVEAAERGQMAVLAIVDDLGRLTIKTALHS